MSLILEALKKSEQQRQQKHSKQQQVRKRTLSLSSNRSGRRSYYWLLAGLVALVFLGAGWFYSHMTGLSQPSAPVAQAASPSNNASQGKVTIPVSKPAVAFQQLPQTLVQNGGQGVSQQSPQTALPSPAETFVQAPEKAAPQALVSVEPAPVPREFVDAPAPPRASPPLTAKTEKKNRVAANQPAQPPVAESAAEMSQQPAAATVSAHAVTGPDGMPFYLDLSEELRARIPTLNMSMHFFARDPDRRLVRINGRLLRQGDWLNDNLQLVEITADGATLDFLGKAFALSSSRR